MFLLSNHIKSQNYNKFYCKFPFCFKIVIKDIANVHCVHDAQLFSSNIVKKIGVDVKKTLHG